MRIEKSRDEVKKDPKKKVKFTNMNHIKEIMSMDYKPSGSKIKKLNKDQYAIIETGEIFDYKHIENRAECSNSLRTTFKKLRNLINTNFNGSPNELMLTITYKENMTDTKRLYTDFDKFMKRLRYKFKNTTKIEYINVVEPQGRGAWHCHILLKFIDLEKAFVPNKTIAALWGQGFVTVKKINTNGVDNIGAYLSAYLGDIELGDDSLKQLNKKEIEKLNVKTVEIDGKEKKFVKGARLHLYPPGMQIFRKSKGIKEPEVSWITYEEAKKIVDTPARFAYHSLIDIFDDSGEKVNSISYEFYNTKRRIYNNYTKKERERQMANVFSPPKIK